MSDKENITLYCEGTPNPLKVSIALEELGLKYNVRLKLEVLHQRQNIDSMGLLRSGKSRSSPMNRKSLGSSRSTRTAAFPPLRIKTRTVMTFMYGKAVPSCNTLWTDTIRTTRYRTHEARRSIGR